MGDLFALAGLGLDGSDSDADFFPLSVVAGVFDVGGSGGTVVGFALDYSGVEDGEVEPGGRRRIFRN